MSKQVFDVREFEEHAVHVKAVISHLIVRNVVQPRFAEVFLQLRKEGVFSVFALEYRNIPDAREMLVLLGLGHSKMLILKLLLNATDVSLFLT